MNEEQLTVSLIYPTLKKVVDSIFVIPGKQIDEAISQGSVHHDIKMGKTTGQSAVDALI